MKTQHTKGEWTVRKNPFETKDEQGDEIVGFDIDSLKEKEHGIATIWGEDEKAQANAKLIAAAPKLLEAIVFLTNTIEVVKEYFPVETTVKMNIQKAKEAIKKATS